MKKFANNWAKLILLYWILKIKEDVIWEVKIMRDQNHKNEFKIGEKKYGMLKLWKEKICEEILLCFKQKWMQKFEEEILYKC